MNKPVGGRGHKAKYESTHARIPKPIKSLVDSLSDEYRSYVNEGNCLDFESKSLLPKVPAIYFVLEDDEIIYIGQTRSLVDRWRRHHILDKLSDLTGQISIAWLQCNDVSLLKTIESILIGSIQPRLNHPTDGKFTVKLDQPKKLRTVRLTNTAWNQLQQTATKNEVSRTDVIEAWARHKESEQEIILKAIEAFVEDKKADWGNNPAQKGEFSTKSRTWDVFNQFRELIKEAPWKLLKED